MERKKISKDHWPSDKLVGAEPAAWRSSVKKVFLEIPQNSQENTCTNSSTY